MLPVTNGLGENTADALNALVPVPTSGGERRPYARAFRFTRACFRIRRLPFGRAPVDLHDTLSVFEAMDVDNCACDRGVSSRGPRFRTGAFVMCAS